MQTKLSGIFCKYAIQSFIAATKALKEGLIDVLVTAPINKYNIQSEEFKFPGHTDYLQGGQHFGGEAAEVHEVAYQQAADAVTHPVHALDALRPRLAQHAH